MSRWVKTTSTEFSQLGIPFDQTEKLFPQQGGFGWLVLKEAIWPALRLRRNGTGDTWIQPEWLADPRGARHRLEKAIHRSLAHFIPHDTNGKVMGVDGILECWKDDVPVKESAVEDLQMIRDALGSLKKLTDVFSWTYKEDPGYDRAFTFDEIQETFAEILPRLFKPGSGFQFSPPAPADPANASILASPHLLAFWFLTTGMVLAELREEKPVSMTFNASEQSIILTVQSPKLLQILQGAALEVNDLFWDWLTLLAQQNGRWNVLDERVGLEIPLKGFRGGKPFLAFGEDEFDSEFEIVRETGLPAVTDAINKNLFQLRGVALGKSLEPRIRGLIINMVSSIREIQLLQPTGKEAFIV